MVVGSMIPAVAFSMMDVLGPRSIQKEGPADAGPSSEQVRLLQPDTTKDRL